MRRKDLAVGQPLTVVLAIGRLYESEKVRLYVSETTLLPLQQLTSNWW